MPHSARLKNVPVKKLAEATDMTLELEARQKDTSPTGITHKIEPAADMLFVARAHQLVQRLKASWHFTRWHSAISYLRVFKGFVLGTETIWHELSERGKDALKIRSRGFKGAGYAFHRIDAGLLEGFKVPLKAQRRVSGRTSANRPCNNSLRRYPGDQGRPVGQAILSVRQRYDPDQDPGAEYGDPDRREGSRIGNGGAFQTRAWRRARDLWPLSSCVK